MLYEGVPIKKKNKEDLSHPAPKHEIVFGRDETIDALDEKYLAELQKEDDKLAPLDDAVFGREVRDREAFGRYLGKRKSMLDRISRFPFLNKKDIEEQGRMVQEKETKTVLSDQLPTPTKEQVVPEKQEAVKEAKELSEAEESALLLLVTDKVHAVGEKLHVNQMDENRIAARVLAEALKNPDLKEQEIDSLVKEGYRKILGDRYKDSAESALQFFKEQNLVAMFAKLHEEGKFNFSMLEKALSDKVRDYKENLLPMHEYFKDEQYNFSEVDKYDKMLADGESTKEYFKNWEIYLQQKKAA